MHVIQGLSLRLSFEMQRPKISPAILAVVDVTLHELFLVEQTN